MGLKETLSFELQSKPTKRSIGAVASIEMGDVSERKSGDEVCKEFYENVIGKVQAG